MTKTLTFTVPIYWTQHFKSKNDKTWLVGLNSYRNWHYHTSNTWKRDFHELIHNQLLKNTISFKIYTLHIELFYKRITMDGSNVVALVEKVTLDSLQDAGILPEDNVQFHKGTTWEVVDRDKDNPRCVITVKEIT